MPQAEVLGYVSAQRSISPELLRPLELHFKRSTSRSMGASCSKSSVALSSKANGDLRSSSQSINSPYLTHNSSHSRSMKGTLSASEADLIPAQHQGLDPAGQLQNALAASAANAVLSEASFSAATAVATAALPTPPQPPTIAQQSFQDASAVYGRPLDRPAFNHKTASNKKAQGATSSLTNQGNFSEALKAVSTHPSQKAFLQLLQQHLFGKQDTKASCPYCHCHMACLL